MFDVAALTSSAEQADEPKVSRLGRGTILLAWDVPQAARFATPRLTIDDGDVAPLASLHLKNADGSSRLLWCLRQPGVGSIEITLSTGPLGPRANLVIDANDDVASLDAEELLRGIGESGRVALISALFNVWGPLFRLQHSRTFTRVLRDLLTHVTPNPGPALFVSQAAGDLLVLRTSVAASLGKIDAIYTFGDGGSVRLPGRAHKLAIGGNGREAVHLIASREAIPSDNGLLVLVGSRGLSIRRLLPSDTALPSIERWFHEQAQAAPSLREHLLIDLAGRSEAGRSIALETQLRSPLQPRRVTSSGSAPSAEVVSALSTPAGMLVTGWYRDHLDLVAGIETVGPEDGSHDLTRALRRFPVQVAGPGKAARISATGFVALAPAPTGAAPILQPRFRLRLRSGASHALVPVLQPADPVEARAAALRAVPPQHVDEALLAEVLAPVIASLHSQAQAVVGQPSIQRIGRPVARPKVSVIVPLYKALDFLRFQIAAFAMDPWFRANTELIYVLDSPEQAFEVEHLLNGLHLVYELPVTLVIMERNGGYARANNVGASLARGDALALVNSDVIPIEAGWLEGLVARLNGRRRVGVVGPKLLFEDGSIQHAGMYFGHDHRGRWLNQHFHKGMPRDYAPAREERIVPAVTGACLVTSRAIFESVGGFTKDYVIGDYEDSDLCLKITTTDRKIAYAADIELYHLERKSMSLNSEYMRGIAWQYNCALHAERWGDLMTTIMQSSGRQRRARAIAI